MKEERGQRGRASENGTIQLQNVLQFIKSSWQLRLETFWHKKKLFGQHQTPSISSQMPCYQTNHRLAEMPKL